MPKNEFLDDEYMNLSIPLLEVYEQFQSAADAEHLISVLKSNNIVYEVEVTQQIIEPAMERDGHLPKVIVKLPLADFELANQLVEEDILRNILEGKVNIRYHFLQDYTTEKLLEVFCKPEGWSIGAKVIARHILKLRGIEFNHLQIGELRVE
jgi:hypothetical protein